MSKILQIEIRINDDKIASGISTTGFDNNSMTDQLLLLGIIENTKGIIKDRIKGLVDIRK